VFSFFSDPHNLEIITPEWLRFRVLSRGIEMKLGSFIDYRLRLRGIPIRWQSEITTWNPPYCFVDQQCRGPYAEWIHTHQFEEMEGSTKVADNVRYDHLGGRWVNYLFVARNLEEIFSYRKSKLQELFSVS
jgi:ligand-binding SRPBCC domain-containing protein